MEVTTGVQTKELQELQKLKEEYKWLRQAFDEKDKKLENLNHALKILWSDTKAAKKAAKKAEKDHDLWEKYALFLEGKIREMTEKKNTYKQMVKSFSDVIKKILPESPVEDSIVL